jgi:uncharacterized membrane protein AbrB (regulator of aidB expression)
MSKSKFEEFHVPFIKNLVFVALVTVVSMISVRYYLTTTLSLPQNTTIYTSSESQISPK